MPGRNQTGPNGMGPMTGRGMGVRNGAGGGQGFNSSFGRGNRMGRGNGFRNGMGQGYGYGYGTGLQQNPIASDVNIAQQTFLENELKMMKEQVASVERELENISKVNNSTSNKEEDGKTKNK